MIAVITDPHWGDLLILGGLIVGFVWLGYLGVQAIKLWIELMRLVQHGKRSLEEATRKAEYADFDADPADDDMTAVMDATRDIAPEDEPSWPGKAPFMVVPRPAPFMTAAPPLTADDPAQWVLAGHLPEKESETSQPRHARIDPDDTPTGLMMPVVDEPPVVDGEAAMDAVAAVVSGQDGAP